MSPKIYSLQEVSQNLSLGEEQILHWVSLRIVVPKDEDRLLFDHEDLSRLRLVLELKENCNPNEEALELILHLIDQIHNLNRKLKEA